MSPALHALFDDGDRGGRSGAPRLLVWIVAVNLAAWALAWRAFAGDASLMGAALLAWLFGLRHGVNADHIAAIDNVVRKLMQDGRRPLCAGLFFALGHSTIVFAASAAVAAAAVVAQDRFESFRPIGSLLGAGVSIAFLLLIGLSNLFVLRNLVEALRRGERGGANGHTHTSLAGSGPVARLCQPLFRMIGRSWHMYPLGLLFGLGFDTASEIGLLGLSATQGAEGLPLGAIMIFPLLFTVAMSLVDTADAALMIGAYGWAFVRPQRKAWYNLAITGLSVAVALVVGGVELVGLVVDRFDADGPLASFAGHANALIAESGAFVVAAFLTLWGVATLLYRRRVGTATAAP